MTSPSRPNALQRELDELERTNPAVAEASRRVDEVSQQILGRGRERLDAERGDLTIDPTEAMQEAGRRMKRIRDVLARKAVVDASAKEQHDEISNWHTQETERFDAELSRLKMEMRPYVEMLVASEPMGRKSVNLVAGRAGFREGRERVIVEDEKAALIWLRGKGADVCTRVKHEVDIPTVKRLFPQPDFIPGIRVEKGERTFYAEPTGEAR